MDLLHDVLIQLESNEKWNNLYTKEEKIYFLTRTITNQFYSNNSKFHKTYRKFNSQSLDITDLIDEEYTDRPSLEWVNQTLEDELTNNPNNWYNVKLFKMYLEYKKIEPIHKKTRIPKYSIRETINHMKKWIKQKWDERCQE